MAISLQMTASVYFKGQLPKHFLIFDFSFHVISEPEMFAWYTSVVPFTSQCGETDRNIFFIFIVWLFGY